MKHQLSFLAFRGEKKKIYV